MLCLTACLSDKVEFDPYKGKPHRVVFTIDPLPANGGGLLLWGKNDNGDTFGRVVTGNTTTVDLNSGNWTYYGMAWAGEPGADENGNTTTNDPMAGIISCAVETKTLTGDGKSFQTISSFSTSNCNNSVFAPSAMVTGGPADYRIGTVKMNFCESVSNITGITDVCTDDLDTTAAPNRKEARGHAMSYRVSLVSYDKDKNGYKLLSSKLSSGCLNYPNGVTPLSGEYPLSLQQIPAGDGSSSPFYLQVEAFPGDYNCSGTNNGYRAVSFPNGIIADSSTAKQFTDGTIHRVYVKMSGDEICRGSSLTGSFAGGDGSAAQPYLICNASQLYNTISNTTSHFKLLKDVDLTRYYKGYSGSSTLPTLVSGATCLENGSNFLPIGMPACLTPGAARTGDFDGGGKTIKGLRIIMSTTTAPDRVGFLSRQSGQVRRITFENAKVVGKIKVGIAVGDSTGAIRTVEVKNSYVEGGQKTGGVAGQMTATVANDINVSGLKLFTTGQQGGGVFGGTDAAPKLIGRRWYVGGEIRAGSIAGGLIANVSAGLDLSEVRFEGYLSGEDLLGGLVGNAGATVLTNAYVNAGINSSKASSPVSVGGLIGFLVGARGSHSISDAYYHGVIRTRCTSGAACQIGNIFGFYDFGTWDPSPPANVYYSTPRLTGTEMSATAWTGLAPSAFISSATAFSAQFTQLDGDIPRLAGELSWHPCRNNFAYETVAIQTNATNKRGTASNPILICNGQQVDSMGFRLTSHFKLANYVLDFNAKGTAVGTNFSGSIDGDGFGLIGSDFSAAGASTAGFDTFSGVWTDMAFYNPRVVQTGSGSGSIVAYTNSGTLSNMKFLGVEWVGATGGSIVRDNGATGVIQNVELQGYLQPLNNMGGVAQKNYGTIDGMTVNLVMTASAAASSVAGLVKENVTGGRISNVELNVTLETLGAASSNQSIVTNYNHPGAVINNIHVRSGTLKGSGSGAHVIATKNEGTISQVVNEANVYIKSQNVPAVNPATDAELDALVTSTVGSNSGTLDDIFYFNEARWIFQYAQRFGVYNGSFGAAPVPDGSGNCIIDVTPSAVPKIQSTAWNAFISPAGAAGAGRLFFAGTTEFSTLVHEVLDTYPSRAGYDSFLLFNNNCGGVVQSSTTWLVYLPGDPHTTAQSTSTLTTWSPWHADLASAVSVLNLGDATDLNSLHEYEFKTLIGSSASKPVWVFTPSKGIRLYGR